MADFNALQALINAYIKKNGVQAITGQILNGILNGMVTALGKGYTIAGSADPTTDPGTMTGPLAYIAYTAGTYTHFGGLEVEQGEVAMLIYNEDLWHKEVLFSLAAVATVDANVGTPSVDVSFVDGLLTFDFHNMKGNPGVDGEDGDAAGFGTVNATVDSNVGTPGVTVQSSGPNTAKNFTFQFTNLKGETGVTSVVATVDNTSGNPQCAVSLNGQQLTLAFTGLKGAQGDTGSSVDYPFTIVNNLTTNDATQALSAAMGVQLESEVSQLEAGVDVLIGTSSTPSPNLFNKDEVSAANLAISKNIGVEFSYTGGICTGFIEIPDGATSLYSTKTKFGGSSGWALYNSSKVFTTGGNTLPIPVSSGDKYLRLTMPSDDYLTAMVIVGTAADVPAEYVPYGTITTYYFKSGVVKTANIEDGAVTTPKIASKAITTEKIADGAITADMIGLFVDIVGKNKLNLNDPDYLTGKYIGTNNVEYINAQLDTSGFIPFTQEMGHLVIGYDGGTLPNEPNYCGINLYNDQKQFVSGSVYSVNHGVATWESGVAYARFVIRHVNEDKTKYQIEVGQTPTSFVPYSVTKELADSSVDVSPNVPVKSLAGNVLKDGTVTSDKLAAGITFPSIRPALSSIGTEGYAETISISAGTTHTFDNCPQYVKRNFNISASGKFTAFSEFEIGVGGAVNNALLVRIDGTNAYLYRHNGSSYHLLKTEAHGLTISSFLNVNVVCVDGVVTARIMSAGNGAKIVFPEVTGYDVYGVPFVKASSGTTFVSLDVRISSASMSRPVWILGDSYVSWYSNRWPKQLVTLFGVGNFHLQGLAGAGSATMYADLVKSLAFGVPRFLVWCLGMNDTAAAWESTYADLVTLCENNGITLVLQTIPWPENGTKADINDDVEDSGLRYFDGYAAVSSDASGTWYTGMCDDGVHPTELGAKALASRFVVDFPEILSIV